MGKPEVIQIGDMRIGNDKSAVFTGDLAGSNPRLWAELRATGNYWSRTYQKYPNPIYEMGRWVLRSHSTAADYHSADRVKFPYIELLLNHRKVVVSTGKHG